MSGEEIGALSACSHLTGVVVGGIGGLMADAHGLGPLLSVLAIALVFFVARLFIWARAAERRAEKAL